MDENLTHFSFYVEGIFLVRTKISKIDQNVVYGRETELRFIKISGQCWSDWHSREPNFSGVVLEEDKYFSSANDHSGHMRLILYCHKYFPIQYSQDISKVGDDNKFPYMVSQKKYLRASRILSLASILVQSTVVE